jgi:dienelactone hydrolase
MAEVVLFHSVLGLTPGVHAAAERLRAAGHVVHTPDRYDGHAPFSAYEPAMAFADGISMGELLRRSEQSVAGLPANVVYCGWSAGGAVAEQFTLTRPGALGLVLIAAAAKLSWFQANSWPGSVPVQIHYATQDPFREEDELQSFMASVRESGASLELYEYELRGHLFDDPSLPDEYDEAAETMWQRILAFVDRAA